MNFGEIVDNARCRCAEAILERIGQRRAEGNQINVEPTPRRSTGEIAFAPNGLKLPLRYDLAFKDSSGVYHSENANSVTLNFSEPVFATWEHRLKIELRSLCWDYMQVELSPLPGVPDWGNLRQWFLKWFDLHDSKQVQADGLQGVLHFISDPVPKGSNICLIVDLGTAPVDALGELFDEFVNLGCTSCVIGKKDKEESQ